MKILRKSFHTIISINWVYHHNIVISDEFFKLRNHNPQFKNKISRVPTMLTKNGKFLVGNEIKNWLESLLPTQELEMAGFGTCSMTTLDGEGTNDMFGLDDYGTSLQPPMTTELQEKIDRSVNDAYNAQSKQN